MSVRAGIYVRLTSGVVYWMPNTWRTGADLDYIRLVRINGAGPPLFRVPSERIAMQDADGCPVHVSPLDVEEWWQQTFLGEDSDHPAPARADPDGPGVVARGRFEGRPAGGSLR